jgi:hemerythrin superfamily protein
MNAIDLLISQHRQMEKLAKEVLDAHGQKQCQTLFERAGDELTAHITSEEDVFYPAVKARRTEDILLESLEEHLSLKRLLADLLELDPTDTTFVPKFKVLSEQMTHHHKEEEEHLFPKVRQCLDAARLDGLGDEMLALQQRLKREGEPREAVASQTDAAAPLH